MHFIEKDTKPPITRKEKNYIFLNKNSKKVWQH